MRYGIMLVVMGVSISQSAIVGSQNYSYDALGRLATISASSGVKTTYQYDNSSNRTQVIVSGVACQTPSSLPVIADGCFESPDVGGDYQYNPTSTGVRFAGNSGVAANGSAWGFPSAPDGKQVAFLRAVGNQTGVITMSVSGISAGQQYVVLLKASQRPGYPMNPFTIAVDGKGLATVSPVQGFSSYATAAFTASSNTASLVLSSTPSSQDAASGVDSVMVIPVPVIADASFEVPSVGNGGYQYNPTAVGAVFSGGAGVAANGSAWGFPTAPDGNQVGFLRSTSDSTGSTSLSVTGLITGQSYLVTFKASHRPNYGTDPVTVTVDGNNLLTVSPPDAFTSYSTPLFVAFSASATIVFSVATEVGDSGSGIDAVTVMPR